VTRDQKITLGKMRAFRGERPPAVRKPGGLWQTPDSTRLFGSASGRGVDLGDFALSGYEGQVLRNHQRPALESLLRKIKVSPAAKMGISEVVAQTEARELAAKWFQDPPSRLAMAKMIEMAGYPPDAIEVEAFQLALPALAPIERLIVSAQKRLDRYLEDLERTSKAHARALRAAAEKAIAKNDAAALASRK
jgi:hypothetical protein